MESLRVIVIVALFVLAAWQILKILIVGLVEGKEKPSGTFTAGDIARSRFTYTGTAIIAVLAALLIMH